MSDENDGAWFAPKRFGYGAGVPIAWQGWAVLAAFAVMLIASSIVLLPRHRLWFIIVAVVLSIALTLLTATKTRGGLHWRGR